MRPIPTIEDPERYIDSAFVDSAFIELKSCDLWDENAVSDPTYGSCGREVLCP